MCGASSMQKDAYDSMKSVRDLLTTNLKTVFKTNTGILDNLVGKLSNIFNLGPNQQGFSDKQLSTLQAQNIDAVSKQGRNAAIATAARMPSATGGAPISSAAQSQINAELNARQGEAIAAGNRDITLKGFDLGNANWKTALQGLSTAPGQLESPIAQAASQTLSSEDQTSAEADKITAANRAWIKPVAGLAVGALTGGLGAGAAGLSTAAGIGKGIQGAAGPIFGVQKGGGGNGTNTWGAPNVKDDSNT